MNNPEFMVVEGRGAYEIIDRSALVYGRESSREQADAYCDRMNTKWERMMREFYELSKSIAEGVRRP